MSVTRISRNGSAGRATDADAKAKAEAEAEARTEAEAEARTEAEVKPEAQRDPVAVLELLDAKYTQSILESIRMESKCARALAEQCGASRPTVYRRLNRLRDAGLVETEIAYDADGHHRTVFEATFEAISVEVTEDGLSVSVFTNGAESPHSPARSVSSG